MLSYLKTPIQQIQADWLDSAHVKLLVKREDLNHPLVSGNKWWKLKHNLEVARKSGFNKLLTFGGAYSNHIFATAAAGEQCGFETIGIIRGEETLPLNTTLSFARDHGMQLNYVSREHYRKKSESAFVENLIEQFGKFYLIPEGGTNSLAVKGCADFGSKIVNESKFDYLCLPVGTGGTMAGLIAGINGKSEILGFSVLKNGEFLNKDVKDLLIDTSDHFSNWKILTEFDRGGYARTDKKLDDFIIQFQKELGIPLEPVYTGKMFFGIYELVNRGYFQKDSVILALHTGGLQATISF